MLWFIGLGISGISELSDNTISIIKNADTVYLESFTSPISETEKECRIDWYVIVNGKLYGIWAMNIVVYNVTISVKFIYDKSKDCYLQL